MIVEPCCYIKQMDGMLAPGAATAHFFTNGDIALPQFLDYFIGRSPQCEVFLSLVGVEGDTLLAIDRQMKRRDRDGNLSVRSFTLLSQGKERTEVCRVLAPYRTAGRMLICEDRESFRCLAVGNGKEYYVLNGSINQRPVFSMQMFTLTTTQALYQQAMEQFNVKKRMKRIKE